MIDLRSDTVTKPSKEMLNVILESEVGDDEYKEDPTVNDLEDFCAELLGFEAGLFVSSGTMGNQISLLNHTNPGEEVITTSDSHIKNYEHGAASFLSRIQFRDVDNVDGLISEEGLKQTLENSKVHKPKISLISIENTHLASGGSIVPFDKIKNCTTIGISSGASAPEILVENFINQIKTKFDVKINEVEIVKEDIIFKVPGKLS